MWTENLVKDMIKDIDTLQFERLKSKDIEDIQYGYQLFYKEFTDFLYFHYDKVSNTIENVELTITVGYYIERIFTNEDLKKLASLILQKDNESRKKVHLYKVQDFDKEEFYGQIIDVFEDFLSQKGITVHNPEKEEDGVGDDVCIYGADYDWICEKLEKIMDNWED